MRASSYAELSKRIIDDCFVSPAIKRRLSTQEIEPEILSLIILTSPLSLYEKNDWFCRLARSDAKRSDSLFRSFRDLTTDIIKGLVWHEYDLQPADDNRFQLGPCLLGTFHIIKEKTASAKELGRMKIACSLAYEDSSDTCLSPSINAESLKGASRNLVFGKWRPSTALTDLYDPKPYSIVHESTKKVLDEERRLREERLTGISFIDCLTFFDFEGFEDQLFGEDRASLLAMHALFAGTFPLGTILALDFTPFYKKRYGLVLAPSRDVGKGNMKSTSLSETMLVRTGGRWRCGALTERDFFQCADPVGLLFNSYARVKEEESPCPAKDPDHSLLRAVRRRIHEDPNIADALMEKLAEEGCSGLTDEELVRFCGIVGQLDDIKGRKAIDIDDYLNSPPHLLLASREVTHPYAELKVGSVAGMRAIRSLGYQMRASIQDLMSELKEQGRDYDLLLEGGLYGDGGRRWNLYLNDDHFAIIDADYGYDCFDESATLFKTRIAELIEDAERDSKVRPLSKPERECLDERLADEPAKWGRSKGLWCR